MSEHAFCCANCKNKFFTDYPQDQLCAACEEGGWVFIGPTPEDPNALVFNVSECTTDTAPF